MPTPNALEPAFLSLPENELDYPQTCDSAPSAPPELLVSPRPAEEEPEMYSVKKARERFEALAKGAQ